MAFIKEQKFTKTSFKKQADVLAAILRTNPIMNDDEKVSVQETVGVLTWLNMLQIHWAKNKEAPTTVPAEIFEKIFEGRGPQAPVNPVERI